MEDMYGLHHHIHHPGVDDLQSLIARIPGLGGPEQLVVSSCMEAAAHSVVSEAASFAGGGGCAASASAVSIGGGAGAEAVSSSSSIKAKIAAHPRYPRLLEAYIDCQKVGAPPEVASLLDEIQRENDVSKRNAAASRLLGADPDLDEFMDTYCDLLVKYKSDLAQPFDAATTFLNNMEVQLSNLCKGSCHVSDEPAGSSDDEYIGEINVQEAQIRNENRDLKDELLHKYSGFLSGLKQEFSKKKKKGKLPREARQTLMDWWNVHLKWPYPTEADKLALAESTGLNQKQVNNWFINQRKRHWKPSDNMQFAVMDTFCTFLPG